MLFVGSASFSALRICAVFVMGVLFVVAAETVTWNVWEPDEPAARVPRFHVRVPEIESYVHEPEQPPK